MCDTMVALGSVTSAASTLFGKNSDREHIEAQHLEWVPAARHGPGEKVQLTYQEIDQVPETLAVLLSKPHWIWGAEMGANSHGLVIGNEAIFSKLEASPSPEIIGMDYVRLALERATEVDEAIDVITRLLRRYGQGGNCGFRRTLAYHNSFLLADRKGAKVLETVDREWVAAAVTDSYAISNALTIESTFAMSSDSLKSRAIEARLHEDDAPFSFRSVFEDETRSIGGHHRRARAAKLLQERHGDLQITDLFCILRDHVEGPSVEGRPGSRICAHRTENPIGQTTASWVSDLGPTVAVHWVTGTAAPCAGIFKPLLLEAGLPNHGPKPGADEDSVSLWWRHEQLRRNLNAAPESLRKVFDQERTDLESQFLNAMAQCPTPENRESLDHARAIVENCWREAWEFESRWLARSQHGR